MAPGMETGAIPTNGFTEGAEASSSKRNPYETNPARIPRDDPFLAQSILYGRYAPQPTDFIPRYQNWYQSDPETNTFWQEVAQRFCTPEYSLNESGQREAFAAGSVIIRVDRDAADGEAAERYSCVNANELSAARKVEESLREVGVTVPVIHFCGTIEGKNVTVESRVPGVSLDVAWRYLGTEQIAAFKNQCRQILQHIRTIDFPPTEPSYICRGLNTQTAPQGCEPERSILFAEKGVEEDLFFTHNNIIPANVVVKDDRIVGLTGWRESGYFGSARAQKVHRSFRDIQAGAKANGTWIDLYDDDFDPSKSAPLVPSKDIALPSVKTEPTSSTLEKFPANDDLETKSLGFDGSSDYPTSKTLANLKNGTNSRASSSDRSSPAASVKPASNKKAGSVATKKGTAKKPAVKKRKANDVDADSVDGRRSNTPASRASKGPGKKQDSVSIAGSPAPEDKKKKTKKGARRRVADEDEEDFEDPNELFCICRRPDNHTWMIGCDGDCEDWYHGKCVNIDSRDEELIERYICPNCEASGQGRTTWKPMCRLPECRKPARATPKNPSKYCTDEHGQEFMRQQTRQFKLGSAGKGVEDLGSMGGILTAGDLKAAVFGVGSVEEFRRLGDHIISQSASPKENTPNSEVKSETLPQAGNGFDINPKGVEYSPDEAAEMERLRKIRDDLLHRKEMLAARSTFVGLLRPRAKGLVEKLKQKEPKGGWKDICGFDSRVSWSDEEFDEWRLSEAGKNALKDGSIEAMAASLPGSTDADGDTDMAGETEDEVEFLTRGVCIKKRCERHKQWIKVQQQDILFEETTADEELARYEQEARYLAESAVLRRWAEKENIPSEPR